MPFVVTWPGRLPQGTVYSHPVISLDIFPTALAAAGVSSLKGRKLDGVNLLSYLEGKTQSPPHSQLFWRTFGGVDFAVREGRFKLVRNGNSAPELYDLEEDPGESKNLASRKPELVRRLDSDVKKWNRELMPPLWKDHIFDNPTRRRAE